MTFEFLMDNELILTDLNGKEFSAEVVTESNDNPDDPTHCEDIELLKIGENVLDREDALKLFLLLKNNFGFKK